MAGSLYATTGVPLDKTLVFADSANEDFTRSEFDQNGTFLIDGWGSPIRYRKLSRERVFIWSCGMNKMDEIGPGQIWDDSSKTYSAGPGGGKFEAMGDDIPMTKVD